MRPSTRRPLTLHVSALSDAEYASYTRSLTEIVGPTGNVAWDDIQLGVREARGWIRGRYGASVDGAVIDQILKHFCPSLSPQDVLTGGQFFAVMRLVCHAQAGATVDESLVFVQANPESAQQRPPSLSKVAPPPPPRPVPQTPAGPSSDTLPTSHVKPSLPPRTPNPFTHTHPLNQPDEPDALASSNPFRTRSLHPSASGPSLSSASSSSASPSPSPSILHRSVHASTLSPPRKPSNASPATLALLPPPRHASLTGPRTCNSSPASAKSLSLTSPPLPPPPKPPKPPQVSSPLMKESLQAAKGAQSAKEVLDGLSRERRWEVIKKSGSSVSTNGRVGSSVSPARRAGGDGAGTPPRREASPPSSFYDVASARIRDPVSYSSLSPSSENDDALALPMDASRTIISRQSPSARVIITPGTPTQNASADHAFPPSSPAPSSISPTHPSSPFQNPSIAAIPNPRRSKSLHHPSPASTPTSPFFNAKSMSASASPTPLHGPPLPPPRRRPESMQAIGRSGGGDSSHNASGHGVLYPFGVNSGGSGDSGGNSGGGSNNGTHVRNASGGSGSGASLPPTRRVSVTGLPHAPRASSSSSSTTTSAISAPTSTFGSGASSGTGGHHENSDGTVLDVLQRTFATLRTGGPSGGRAAAAAASAFESLESARVRAEGRVWPGGYVKGLARGRREGEDGEGGSLVRHSGEEEEGGDADRDGDGDDGGFGQDGGAVSGRAVMERDELKLPVRPGEGWKVLA